MRQRERKPAPGARFGIGLLVSFLGFVAAGCGGGSSDQPLSHIDYQEGLIGVVRNTATANSLYSGIVTQALPPAECAARTRDLQAEIDGLLGQVDDLNPPVEVVAYQEKLLDAAGQTVDQIGAAAEEAEAGQIACGPAMNQRIYALQSTVEAEAAINLIEQQGYSIFGY